MKKIITVYITCNSEREATQIGKQLLDNRLIACYNIHGIKSGYVWNGETHNDEEVVLLCKSKNAQMNSIETKVKELHSYDVPCIYFNEVMAIDEYADWVFSQVD